MGNIYEQDISKHQWENRILVIKTDDEKNELFVAQLKQLKINEAGLIERKLIVYQIKGQYYREGLGIDGEWKKIETNKLIRISRDNQSNFEAILIGLDSRIKLRQETVLSKEKLFGIIDSMPMRIQELENIDKK